MGGRDYLRILAGDTDYVVDTLGQRGVYCFEDYPAGLRTIWAVNITAGSLAPLLLLARSRWSAPTATTAALAQAVLLVVTSSFRDRWEALGAPLAWFDIGIGVVTAAFAVYCFIVRRRQTLG